MGLWKRLLTEETGADATEYALLAALIAVALIVGATTLGGSINGIFNKLGDKVNTQAATF
ncbi:MAG: Flp family type IVb pilin [Chloroflexota bacterium]|nr:MAG: Flp family type IVb pilin [Chloroflexota bacterium]